MAHIDDPKDDGRLMDQREERERALRTLAEARRQSEAGKLPPPMSLAPARKRRKVWAINAAALVVILVATSIVIHGLVNSSPPRQVSTSQSSIVPSADGMSCEQDAAWSPDATYIAILGYQRGCPVPVANSYQYWPGMLSIYDVRSKFLVSQLNLDTIVAKALNLSPPQGVTPVPFSAGGGGVVQQAILYSHVLWLPHASQIAITFAVPAISGSARADSAEAQSVEGVLLTDLKGSQTVVLSHTLMVGAASQPGMWDLSSRTFVPARTPDSQSYLVPSMIYSWDNHDALTATVPLSATALPTAQSSLPVGNPDGGTSFGIWQPTEISPLLPSRNREASSVTVSGVYSMTTLFLALSPDARFLSSVDFTGLLDSVTSPPGLDDLQRQGLAALPLVPVRDKALAHALAQIPAAQNEPGVIPIHLAWSPSGRMLAVQTVKPDSSGNLGYTYYRVAIYDCATGKQLATFTPHNIPNPAGNAPTLLRWAPDSSHLLLYDGNLGAVTVWGPSALPRDQ